MSFVSFVLILRWVHHAGPPTHQEPQQARYADDDRRGSHGRRSPKCRAGHRGQLPGNAIAGECPQRHAQQQDERPFGQYRGLDIDRRAIERVGESGKQSGAVAEHA